MKHFTAYQKEELIALLDIRVDSIVDDIESASGIETVPGALDILRGKIESDNMDFTDDEREWIVEEAETRIKVCYGNMSSEGAAVLGLLRSMQNVIDKVSN